MDERKKCSQVETRNVVDITLEIHVLAKEASGMTTNMFVYKKLQRIIDLTVEQQKQFKDTYQRLEKVGKSIRECLDNDKAWLFPKGKRK